jgi:uncharacterized RDD family membrane protein YckC
VAEFAAVSRRTLAGRRRSLVTPEGVDLHLSLAEGSQRVGAFLIDLVIMVATLIALFLICLLTFAAIGSDVGAEIAGVIFLLGFLVLRCFYFILMEMGPRAATLGKRAVGIRVVARNGERLTADRVIARNLMREIEFYLPLSFLLYNGSAGAGDALTGLAGLAWTGLFLLFPLFNKDRLRVGDLLAGTWVVNSPKRQLGHEIGGVAEPGRQQRFTEAQLDVYGIYELQTLERVLREDQPEAIATVASTIRGKIGAPDEGYDRDFLIAYYDAARARMERGLLFGKRREDKYDRPGALGHRLIKPQPDAD